MNRLQRTYYLKMFNLCCHTTSTPVSLEESYKADKCNNWITNRFMNTCVLGACLCWDQARSVVPVWWRSSSSGGQRTVRGRQTQHPWPPGPRWAWARGWCGRRTPRACWSHPPCSASPSRSLLSCSSTAPASSLLYTTTLHNVLHNQPSCRPI